MASLLDYTLIYLSAGNVIHKSSIFLLGRYIKRTLKHNKMGIKFYPIVSYII